MLSEYPTPEYVEWIDVYEIYNKTCGFLWKLYMVQSNLCRIVWKSSWWCDGVCNWLITKWLYEWLFRTSMWRSWIDDAEENLIKDVFHVCLFVTIAVILFRKVFFLLYWLEITLLGKQIKISNTLMTNSIHQEVFR